MLGFLCRRVGYKKKRSMGERRKNQKGVVESECNKGNEIRWGKIRRRAEIGAVQGGRGETRNQRGGF